MKRTLNLALFISVIAIIATACSFGGNNNGTDNGTDNGEATILFQDQFADTNSGWDRYKYPNEEGSTDYDNGTYKIDVNVEGMFYWANPYKEYGDVIVEVAAAKTSGGDDMQYGIICRQKDVNNFYALIVTADGFAAVRKRFAGADLEILGDAVQDAVIKTGDQTNLLRAECIGDELTLFVNGKEVISITDSDIATGDVGLMAGTFEQPETEVRFDNFVVKQP